MRHEDPYDLIAGGKQQREPLLTGGEQKGVPLLAGGEQRGAGLLFGGEQRGSDPTADRESRAERLADSSHQEQITLRAPRKAA